jgi:Ca-activated chloride channel homolog
VGVVFDCSGSMGHKLDKSRQAVAQFFRLASPEDEFFLVQFNDTANLIQPFTRNLEEMIEAKSRNQSTLLKGISLRCCLRP